MIDRPMNRKQVHSIEYRVGVKNLRTKGVPKTK